ncbi:MAG: sulfur carrier protein ThiS [Nitrospirota bacterium]
MRFFVWFMKIKVNGEEMDTAAETLEGLIGECRLEPQKVAVEVNLGIVRKAEYGTFRLKEGDVVEIVSFVGGG